MRAVRAVSFPAVLRLHLTRCELFHSEPVGVVGGCRQVAASLLSDGALACCSLRLALPFARDEMMMGRLAPDSTVADEMAMGRLVALDRFTTQRRVRDPGTGLTLDSTVARQVGVPHRPPPCRGGSRNLLNPTRRS